MNSTVWAGVVSTTHAIVRMTAASVGFKLIWQIPGRVWSPIPIKKGINSLIRQTVASLIHGAWPADKNNQSASKESERQGEWREKHQIFGKQRQAWQNFDQIQEH